MTEPTAQEMKDALDGVVSTFETFKSKNDERLAEIEKRGTADAVTEDEFRKVRDSLSQMTELKKELEKMKTRLARQAEIAGDIAERATPEEVEHRDAFVAFLRNRDDFEARNRLHEAEKSVRLTRDVQTTVPADGGDAVPEMISRTVERELKEISPMRELVDVQQVGTKDYKVLVDVHGTTYGYVGETDARTPTNTPKLEEVAPTFGTIYAYPKATEESLEDIFFDVERWLVDSIVEGFDEGEEASIIAGSGTKRPTGILTAPTAGTADGVRAFGTLQTINSGAAANFAASDPADPMVELVYSLKKGYRSNARWLMNKATLGSVMSFKDGQGNYLFRPAATAGQPDAFLGYPIAESEQMPDVAADATPIAFGDFRAGYILANLVGLRLTKDDNITQPGYVKWYARRRHGGIVKRSEAIKLLKIAA